MKIPLLFSLFIAMFLLGCSPSTKLEHSWREPNYAIDTAVTKHFVICALLSNESTRRAVEQEIVKRSKGKAIPSYNYFQTSQIKGSEDAFTQKMMADGANIIIIMRLADQKTTQTYVPGTTYYGGGYGWGGYYGYAAPMYYDPGYVRTDVHYITEINIYDLKLNKLVWSGLTSTVNPYDAHEMVNGVADVVDYQMRQEGFFK
jgi:hypothetical protein